MPLARELDFSMGRTRSRGITHESLSTTLFDYEAVQVRVARELYIYKPGYYRERYQVITKHFHSPRQPSIEARSYQYSHGRQQTPRIHSSSQ